MINCAGSPSTDGVERAERAPPTLVAAGLAYLVLGAVAGWVILQVLPDRVELHLIGRAVSVGGLHRRLMSIWIIMELVIPAIFVAELLFVGWRQSSLRRLAVEHGRSAMTDLVCFLCGQGKVMTLLALVFSLGTVLVSGAWLHDRLTEATGLSFSLAWTP